MERGKTDVRILLALHCLLVLMSLSGVMSKFAARFEFMSVGFVLCYGAMVVLLGVYALGWQQVIKRIPLTTAYANRAVTVLWGIVWGALLFHEGVNPLKIAGALVVLFGVVLYAVADNSPTTAESSDEGGAR